MSKTIQLRCTNPEESEKMAQFESPDGDEICASYIDQAVASQLGEYAAVTVSEEADVNASLQKTTSNYGVYETAGGAVTGMYIAHDTISEATGLDEAPESIGLNFSPSSEDEFGEALEEAQSVDEDEVDGLLGGTDEQEEESAPSEEEEADGLVEISDEELDLEA